MLSTENESLTCGKMVNDRPCGEKAVTFYLHGSYVCCYCEHHPYVCGEPLTKEQAEKHITSKI